MKNDIPFFTRHTLGNFIDRSTRLGARSFKGSVVPLLVVLVPLSVCTIFFVIGYFQILLDLVEASNASKFGSSAEVGAFFLKLVPFGVFILAWGLLSAIGSGIAQAYVSRAGYLAASQEPVEWTKLLPSLLREKFGAIVGYTMLELLIAGFGTVLLVSIFTVLATITGVAESWVLMAAIIVFGGMIVICYAIWAQVMLRLGFPALANETVGAWGAVKKSFSLVKGSFWRVFGLCLVVDFLIYLVVYTASTPFQVASVVPMYVKIFQDTLSGNSMDESLMIAEIMNSFKAGGIAIGLAYIVQYFITWLFTVAFNTLLFIDLKVRRNELVDVTTLEMPPEA